MRLLSSAGSSSEHPSQSYNHVQQNGYGDGYGNYGTRGKGWHRPFGPSGPMWPTRDIQQQDYFGDKGYGPAATRHSHGGKGKNSKAGGKAGPSNGKGKGDKPFTADSDYVEESDPSQSSRRSNGFFAKRSRRQRQAEAAGTAASASDPESMATESPEEFFPEVSSSPGRSPGSSPSPQAALPVNTGPILPISTEARAITTQMESIQTLIYSLRGRTDEYSLKCRAGLENDLHLLRIRRTKLKPLVDQTSILEALVEKRSSCFTASEEAVQKAIAEMEAARESLMVAQQQLLQVKEMKAKEDTATMARQAEEKIPDNLSSVNKMKDLMCLLPVEMAASFGQCLQLLDGLLAQAKAAPHISEVQDSDSEMGGSSVQAKSPIHEHLFAPLFGGGGGLLHPGSPSSDVGVDPYQPMQEDSGCKTPPRRSRSEEPKKSPGNRSRSHSIRRHGRVGQVAGEMRHAFSSEAPVPSFPP